MTGLDSAPPPDIPAAALGPDILPADCSPATRQVYAYWDRKRGERPMPARADILPHEIPSLLPGLIIVDVWRDEAPWRLTYRLIGTAVTRAVGRDATGRDVRVAHHGHSLDATMSKYRLVIDGRRPLYDSGRTREVRYPLAERGVLLLPLSDDGTQVDNVLGFIDIALD